MEYKIIMDGRIIDSWPFERLPREYVPGVSLLLAALPDDYKEGLNYPLEGVGYIYRCIWSEGFEVEFEAAYLKQQEAP